MPQKKPQAAPVRKPFLTGSPYDCNSLRSAAMILLMLVLAAIVYLVAATVLMIDITVVRIALNAVMLIVTWELFSASGRSNGAVAVNQGEIMYRRQERGDAVTPRDRSMCFHPLKGFVIGLLGSLPLFLIAAVLALTTSRQITTAGALPAWMSSMAEDPEFSSALSAYVVGQSIGVTDILRVLIRMELLPWVNLIGSENSGALLIMERLSPVLVLIPGLCYGWGYTRGVNERSRVHTSIAAGNRRHARKEAKARKARAASTPKQLN